MFLACFPCSWLVKTRSFGTFNRPFYIDQLMITFAEKDTHQLSCYIMRMRNHRLWRPQRQNGTANMELKAKHENYPPSLPPLLVT